MATPAVQSVSAFPFAASLVRILLPFVAPGAISFGALVMSWQLPDGAVASFFRGAGAFGCGATILFIWMLRGLIWKEWELYEDERRAAFAPPAAPVQVQVTHTEQRGEVTHTEVHDYPNPPSEAFIKWLFEHIGPGGRIPGERAIEDQWHEQSDVWLDVLEKEKLVEKTGEHKNAPRRIVVGVTLATARQRFGYEAKP